MRHLHLKDSPFTVAEAKETDTATWFKLCSLKNQSGMYNYSFVWLCLKEENKNNLKWTLNKVTLF